MASKRRPFSEQELTAQHARELPNRDQMVAITLLGLPLVGLDGVTVNVDTSGPGWLVGGPIGSV